MMKPKVAVHNETVDRLVAKAHRVTTKSKAIHDPGLSASTGVDPGSVRSQVWDEFMEVYEGVSEIFSEAAAMRAAVSGAGRPPGPEAQRGIEVAEEIAVRALAIVSTVVADSLPKFKR